jgi:23S rRNA pseudouridine1911/1915/1917 synthase
MSLSVEPNSRVTFGTPYEDDDVVVVEKPTGIAAQPGKGHVDDTLLNGLFARWPNQLQNLGKSRDFGLLHRLDKETSGLLIVALRPAAYDRLRDDFANRRVRKFYWAICSDAPKKPTGVIRMPIIESPKAPGPKNARAGSGSMKLARITRAGSGKPAVTAYRTLETSDHACLIEARPVTGRLHQVRLHLEAIGAPILGDTLYGPRRVHGATPRLALHSHRVVFTHPVTGETIDVHTGIPKDFKRMLKNFKLSGRTEPAEEPVVAEE